MKKTLPKSWRLTAAHALQLDSTDAALKEAGIFEFDTVLLHRNHIQESIVTTLNVKEAVCRTVAKASSEVHGKLLKRVGADHVILFFLSNEVGLARSLTKPVILDRFDLDPDNSIVELIVPDEFHGKTITEIQPVAAMVWTAAVSRNDKFEINPDPRKRLERGSAMVVIGCNKDINRRRFEAGKGK